MLMQFIILCFILLFLSIDLSTSSPMPPSSSESGGSSKSNESLPSNKSESTQKVVDNFMNNPATDTDTDSKRLCDADTKNRDKDVLLVTCMNIIYS